MKQYIFILIVFVLCLSSCDYFESPDDTASVQQGFITFPAVDLDGGNFLIVEVGSDYSEPGFSASLGSEDITSSVVVTGEVDASTAGLYVVNYSIETTNELDQVQTVVQTREVLVRNTANAEARDLSGQYQGAGFGGDIATVTKLDGIGHYMNDKALASGNNLGVEFYDDGEGGIHLRDQSSRFGNVNTTTPGTMGSITDSGFEWIIFIGCCGNFGPITFTKL